MIAPVPEDPSHWQTPNFVAKFLENVRGAVPLSIEQIDVMLQLIAVARGERVGTFLDLGCGDGMLAAAILDEHPEARAVLVDLRGFGESTGEHITFGVMDAQDLKQLTDALQQKHLCGDTVGVYGTSYGAASAIFKPSSYRPKTSSLPMNRPSAPTEPKRWSSK